MNRLLLIVLFFPIWAFTGTGMEQVPDDGMGNILNPAELPEKIIIRDAGQRYWTFFRSSFYGFDEFWTAYSTDKENWSRPLCTGIPVLPGKSYQIRVGLHQIDIDWFPPFDFSAPQQYFRAAIDTTVDGYTILKSTLYKDSDSDGLSDLSEDVLWTQPFNMDTDDDSLADGYDTNPLAAHNIGFTVEEKLHQYILEFEMNEFPSNQLIIAEQPSEHPIEYKRKKGIVLSLSPQGCDAYLAAHGYGVPILTCNVTPLESGRYQAFFQFFISPDDAWGYDSIFEWDVMTQSFLLFQSGKVWQVP
ncbi:MAG: hypothetical protein EHM72_18195 [Calditrichaeota bacterium]|nr:MAG: hypothetical protein EHM72_18195 [Calditrichota bacterium]